MNREASAQGYPIRRLAPASFYAMRKGLERQMATLFNNNYIDREFTAEQLSRHMELCGMLLPDPREARPAWHAFMLLDDKSDIAMIAGRQHGQMSPEHADIARNVLSRIYRLLVPETGGGFVVAWGVPDPEHDFYYTELAVLFKDADGDQQYSYSFNDPPVMMIDDDFPDVVCERLWEAFLEWQKQHLDLGLKLTDGRYRSRVVDGQVHPGANNKMMVN